MKDWISSFSRKVETDNNGQCHFCVMIQGCPVSALPTGFLGSPLSHPSLLTMSPKF